ncbi:glyoxalase-like domain-containing protein [Bombardia bombarda]|uniref:Glyoxalase-like domain-containing protein n=1 Tax=Bombardia bombarda TaxID=252184 RepID=A0AA39XDG1_9PEZI|nr:glyoxalase-like domain-containing protein [Bombardia bombarda]
MAPANAPAVALDHIVLLVSPHFLSNLPAWITAAFTILPGGQHADGVTENKLIIFSDGTYIEMIAFVHDVDPAKRAAHRWGACTEGEIVDWALTLLSPAQASPPAPEEYFPTIQAHVRAAQQKPESFTYLNPSAGGRITPEGTEVRWAVAAPKEVYVKSQGYYGRELGFLDITGGELPFWCLDRTPRELRVPYQQRKEVTEHPSLVMGVAGVELFVKGEQRVEKLRRVYHAVLGGDSKRPDDGGAVSPASEWTLPVPATVSAAGDGSLLVLEELRKSNERVPKDNTRSVHVSISLFTTGSPKTLTGETGDGRFLSLRLIPATNTIPN